MRLSRWAGLAAVTVALIALSAQSADARSRPDTSGGYTNTVVGPTIYQTNDIYQSTDMVPLTGTPSTGTIGSVSYSWSYLTYPTGYTFYFGLCDHYRCVTLGSSYGGGSSGSTTAFAGDNALTDFAFYFDVYDTTTHTITPCYGARDSINVNYTF